jgi:hypothetical protein
VVVCAFTNDKQTSAKNIVFVDVERKESGTSFELRVALFGRISWIGRTILLLFLNPVLQHSASV